MQFGQAVGTAAITFALTNIDDAFVLVTFFAESAHSKSLTPLKITIGQYIGFTIIILISLIGFGVSLVLPSEPIGFLGLLPILLGFWKLLELLLPSEEQEPENLRVEGIKSILKVAFITLLNGGDDIGTYIPLFSQVKGAEIAIYVVVFYILLGVWCLVGYLIIKQRHILYAAQKYVGALIPFLYLGLGVYIIVESGCYPWSLERIDGAVANHPGRAILASITAFLLLVSIGIMTWVRLSKRRKAISAAAGVLADRVEDALPATEVVVDDSHTQEPIQLDAMPRTEQVGNDLPTETSSPCTHK
ncbi:cadmium resistance transporter-domain-containing protein [Xylaria digitata]|nr:cadmium resistance transporter-domain-containing protein [Xylaria digitata]